jgi:putative hemolysin
LRFANGRYFATVGNSLVQSTDLVTWSTVTTGLPSNNDICWTGTNYVAVGTQSPYVRYSSDLTTWTTPTGIGTGAAFYCASNGSGTVVVTQTGTGGFNAVRSTNNGVTFSNVSTTLPSSSARVSFAASTYFYLGANELWTSTDGTSWSQRSTGVFNPTGYIAYDGSTFVASNSTSGSIPAYTSTPGSLGTWTARNTTARDVAGGAGGAGGTFGGGGGGGGSSNNGNNSGAGGPGGAGYARIYSW